MGEQVGFVSDIRVWTFRVSGKEYHRYLIVLPRQLHELVKPGKKYKVTLEILEND